MSALLLDTDIRLPDGLSCYEVHLDRDPLITFDASGKSTVFVAIEGSGTLHVRTFARRNAHVNYLFWNRGNGEVTIDESHEVMEDAEVTSGYSDCAGHPIKRNAYMALRGRGAKGALKSALLVQQKMDFNLQVVNFAPETDGNIENYAVVLKTGTLMIDAIGKIVKGAKRSTSHQTSRALSMEDGQRSTILPELLIDENDVQASHAMSMGRVDEEQLYYMMSRGLSSAQCTALIASGYLLPICTLVEDEKMRESLTKEMEERIATLCSM